jgi:hypothetical protein
VSDFVLTFGKHKGKTLSEIPLDYAVWIAEKSYNVSAKNAAIAYVASKAPDLLEKPAIQDRYATPYYRTYYSEDEIEEMRESDRIYAQDDEKNALELEEEMKKYRLSWETSGHTIFIEMQFDDVSEHYFHVIVDGGHPYKEYEIEEYTNPAHPAIVAKIGRVGLTAERRDALLAMLK